MTPALEVDSLTVSYGGLVAVDDVTFAVPHGGVVGLIGPNGAGKTSCIDAIAGFTRPPSGRVRFAGEDVTDWPAHRRARHGLVRTFQSVELFDDLTVRENLLVAAVDSPWWAPLLDAVWPHRARSVDVDWALAAVGVTDDRDRLATDLPHGRRRLVGLARALASRPTVVLLDEPAAGLDTAETEELGSRIRGLPDLGIATVLVDHDMGLVLGTCDEVHVLDFGRRIASGAPDDVRRDPQVVAAYLGEARTRPGTRP